MSKNKQPRKELTSLRLEPRVKYMAEIASRIQRRSLTNYIEWALEESLEHVELADADTGRLFPLSFLQDYLWDIDEIKRFLILAINYQDLLTYEEEKLYSLIKKYRYIYLRNLNDTRDSDLNSPLQIANINFDILNDYWNDLQNASNGNEESLSILENKKQEVLTHYYKSIGIDPYTPKTLREKIEEFQKNLTTPKTKEDYEKQVKELNAFIDSLYDITD